MRQRKILHECVEASATPSELEADNTGRYFSKSYHNQKSNQITKKSVSVNLKKNPKSQSV